MDDEKLIDIVRNFRWLYDTKHTKFFKAKYRDKTWSDVALKMCSDGSVTMDDCKKRWKQLKDSYRKQIFKNPNLKSKWRLSKQMSFMDAIIIENQRYTRTVFKKKFEDGADTDNNNDDEDNYNGYGDFENGNANGEENCFIVPTSPTPILKGNDWFLNHTDETIKDGVYTDTNDELTESYRNGINMSPSVYPNSTNNGYMNQTFQNGGAFHENPLDRNLTNFMRFVETTVQNLSIIQQVEVKRKINEVISETEMQNALAASNSMA